MFKEIKMWFPFAVKRQKKLLKLLERLVKQVGYNGIPLKWYKRTMLKNNLIEKISSQARKGRFRD